MAIEVPQEGYWRKVKMTMGVAQEECRRKAKMTMGVDVSWYLMGERLVDDIKT